MRICWVVRMLLVLAATTATNLVAGADQISEFEPPVRLKSAGYVIDTGFEWGHSGPCVVDVDGDGLRDLVVGDFSGKFRFYRNVATNPQPEYEAVTYLQAGGVDAQVPIYCCIGSSPHFADLNGDGHLDLLSGSYDPGEIYYFEGTGNGQFKARQTLSGKNGKPILTNPHVEADHGSFGSFVATVDWDDDGDLDLLLGHFLGEISLRLNEGTRTAPAFADDNIPLKKQGSEQRLKVPGRHAALCVADWDGDGLFDIISGSEAGGAWLFQNVGQRGKPAFAAPSALVPAFEGTGFRKLVESETDIVPGIRTQAHVVDYDLDGQPDLLLGDFCNFEVPRTDLTPDERAKFMAIWGAREQCVKLSRKMMDGLRESIQQRYPGDALFSRAADETWAKEWGALQESEEWKALREKSKAIEKLVQEFLKPVPESAMRTTDHGYVWLFRRKPVPAVTGPVKLEIHPLPQSVKPGAVISLEATLHITPGWHIAACDEKKGTVPTQLELQLPNGIAVEGDWNVQAPLELLSAGGNGRGYMGQACFSCELKVSASVAAGSYDLVCRAHYQPCNDHQCLREVHQQQTVSLRVE